MPVVPDVGPDSGPSFRLWPPVSVGVPLVAGLLLSSSPGDPWHPSRLSTVVGFVLLVVFGVWNGWALLTMGRRGTGLLPGQASTTILDSGPFAFSRNPLYVGLLVLSAGIALLAGSLWAVLALPLEWALLRWGAVLPEEHYLAAKFGATYADYRARVRRWV
jgi:protein-S-isoprenylcysteine O-methyltransferase Ste14